MSATRGPHAPGRDELDRYYTPVELCEAAIRQLPQLPWGLVVEPSVGSGSWIVALRRVLGEGGYMTHGVDVDPAAAGLSMCHSHQVGDWSEVAEDVFGRLRPAWVIGNPPYRHMRQHLRLCLGRGARVAVLLRLGALATLDSMDLQREHPPTLVMPIAPRPSFSGDGRTDASSYAVVVWDRKPTMIGSRPQTMWRPLDWRRREIAAAPRGAA